MNMRIEHGMKLSTSLILICVLIGCLAPALPMQAQNLVVNGSFESPAIPGGSFALYNTIPGWTSESGLGIEVQNNAYSGDNAYDGAQNIEIASGGSESFYQDIATTPGATYTLAFQFSARPGVQYNGISVLWDGNLIDTVDADGRTNSHTEWQLKSYRLVATSATTRLLFRNYNTNLNPTHDVGGLIDDVSVTFLRGYVVAHRFEPLDSFLGYIGGTSMNNYGDVAGIADAYSGILGNELYSRATIFYPDGTGKYIPIGAWGYGALNIANAINDQGAVIGVHDEHGGPGTPFLYSSSGVISSFPPLNMNGATAYVSGINNSNLVVGNSTSNLFIGGYPTHATYWENEVPIDMANLMSGLGVNYSTGQSINDSGQATGYASYIYYVPFSNDTIYHNYAFVWDKKGGMRSLNTPYPDLDHPGNYLGDTIGQAISNDGRIVGRIDDGNGLTFSDGASLHAFYYYNGAIKDLGSLPGYNDSNAIGVNSKGQIVGNVSNRQGASGFLWDNGVMTELHDLVIPSGQDYWIPTTINERSEILAYSAAGIPNGYASPVLLTPAAMNVSSQVRTISSGLIYNRSAHTFNGTVTITNSSSGIIYGPLQVEVDGLPGGATLVNQAGLHNGNPYIYFNNVIKLMPGGSVSVPVQISYVGTARLGYTITTYTGAFAQ
jgi:probable HAF family extracellular repeat protein